MLLTKKSNCKGQIIRTFTIRPVSSCYRSPSIFKIIIIIFIILTTRTLFFITSCYNIKSSYNKNVLLDRKCNDNKCKHVRVNLIHTAGSKKLPVNLYSLQTNYRTYLKSQRYSRHLNYFSLC